MRGLGLTALVFVLCLALVIVYIFVGRVQLVDAIHEVRQDNEALQTQVDQIRVQAQELPKLKGQLPVWRSQLKLLKQAVPETIEDERFFEGISRELRLNGVNVLHVEMAKGTPWLGKATEEQLKSLDEAGIDVGTAQMVKAAFYSINLLGDFDKVLRAFEGLKRHRRLYSIDQVAGPSGGAPGTVMEITDASTTPIQLTGKIFYGIPKTYLSIEELDKVFANAVAVPVARKVKAGVSAAARSLITPPGSGADSAAATAKERQR
jgi:hypothetical protein